MSGAISVRRDFPASVITVKVADMENVTPSGPALRRERRALGLAASDVARHFGASEPRIRALEAQLHVRSDTARRYIAAIAQAHRERERAATAEALERAQRMADLVGAGAAR